MSSIGSVNNDPTNSPSVIYVRVSSTSFYTINTDFSGSLSLLFGSMPSNNPENLSPTLMISSSNLNTNIVSSSESDSTLSPSSIPSLSSSMPSILL